MALEGELQTRKRDEVVTEEPLELALSEGGATRTLAVTMRTPGNDFELAAGFLYDEAIVRSRDDIIGMSYCLDAALNPQQQYNVVTVECRAGAAAVDPHVSSAISRSAVLAAFAGARSSTRCAIWE